MDLFVGRSIETTEALELLSAAHTGQVLDLVGIRGIGKTMFLQKLLERAGRLNDVVVRSIDLMSEGIGQGHHQRGDQATGTVFSETFSHTCRLMIKWTEGYEQDFKLFRLKLLDPVPLPVLNSQQGNAITLGRKTTVGPVTMTTNLRLGDTALRDHFIRLQSRIDDEFVAAWRSFTVRRRVLITVDSAELIADDEIGAWLLRIAPRLARTLVVVARIPTAHDFGHPSERLVQRQLTHFTREEVRQYLTVRLVGDQLPEPLTEVVHAFTDGHPYGVALTVELIDEVGSLAQDPSYLRRLLARVPDDSTKWGALINALLDQVSEPLFIRAVAAAAVVQRFDEPMLADLLGDDPPHIDAAHPTEEPRPAEGTYSAGGPGPPDDVGEAMKGLRSYRLAHPVLSISGRPTRWSRLHEFVRQAVDHKLRTDQWREWHRLHRRAADHCFRWLQNWQESGVGAYGSWYRYEDPEWQAYMREWLHHSGFLVRRQEVARARFTLVFLEAFYWWGCYCPFDFNRQLIEDWERATAAWPAEYRPGESPGQVTPEQRLADALIFLLGNYPPGGHKPATADWDEIRDRLLLVRDLCGLGNTRPAVPAEEASQMARTDALIKVFLAHTRRFRDAADPVGERYYRQAQQGFERLDDTWMVAWIQRERAEHAMERGDWPTGEAFWRAAAEETLRLSVADDEWDHELAADLHRLSADADWTAGAMLSAANGYGAAVAEAYWYQNRPHPPDEYTQEFYLEITRRAADRIVELGRRSDVDATLRFAAEIRQQVPDTDGAALDGQRLAAAIRAGDRTAITAVLFLAGPGKGELRVDDSAFLRRWRLRWEDDAQDPAGRLATLLAARVDRSG